MNHRRLVIILSAALLAGATVEARAQSDGYCDYVQGVASSESALMLAPELFTSFGYLDQLSGVTTPGGTSDDLRFTLGVGYRLSGLYQSQLVRKRAGAECRRHRALSAINGGTNHRALAAKAAVLDEAMSQAERMLSRASEDLARRRTTRQELISTRLRVEGLRGLTAATRRQLEATPDPGDDRSMTRALAGYYSADGEVERQEASLRRARAWDLSVRVGYDKFLDNDDSSPYFAVVSASFNLGWFLQGSSNRRAATGRRAIVRDARGISGVDATATRLRSLLAIDRRRAEETSLLVGDLEQQLQALKSLDGEGSRRLAETVWFEWVEARAEHAYLTAHVASLEQIVGGEQ
ncbi:MAG TPA: hypothetical protein VML75_22470 [Kofleriaceae bacterium]|nr:hypothetical protein [Kofleriaceae bacterium]